MPDLHNPVSGRLDAARIAEWFGMPLKSLAGSLGRGYATVHKTPDAAALQDRLAIFLRIASALSRLAGSREGAKAWLNAPNPDLEDNRTPLSAIESGEQAIIAELLEDALPLPTTGPIGLEGDRGQMEYRHIELKEVP